MIGITESKIDDSVTDGEIRIDGYVPLRSDRNRQGGGVVCYIRRDISFNRIDLPFNNTEFFFLTFYFPKPNQLIGIGILYRPPKQAGFLNNISATLTNIPKINERETYILGDIYIYQPIVR